MREYVINLEGLRGNRLRFPITSVSFSIIPLTTELRVLVPQVALESLGRQAPETKNEYAADLIAQLATDLRASLPELAWESNASAEMTDLGEVNTAASMPARIANLGLWSAARIPAHPPQTASDLLRGLGDQVILPISNERSTLTLVSNSLSEAEASTPRRSLRRLQLLLEELSREVRKREEQAESGLMQVAQRVSAAIAPLITPPPRRAPGAVPARTRGRAPRRGAVRTHGEVLKEGAQLTGVVLDEAWEPERTVQLAVEEGPEVWEGRLTLVLRGEEAALIGRRADLVLKVEGGEVALGSAKIREVKGEERWKLTFDLDLAGAGLKVGEGTLPPRALQVIIEPVQKSAKEPGKQAP